MPHKNHINLFSECLEKNRCAFQILSTTFPKHQRHALRILLQDKVKVIDFIVRKQL